VYEQVPVFIYQQFGLDLAKTDPKTRTELRELYNWVSEEIPEDKRTPGNITSHIASLQRRFGQPNVFEPAYRKVHTYLALTRNIKDMQKRREALAGLKEK